MVLHKPERRNYGRQLLVSIKYQNLHSFKEGLILLCQSILETRRITHLHASVHFTIPLIPLLWGKSLFIRKNSEHLENWEYCFFSNLKQFLVIYGICHQTTNRCTVYSQIKDHRKCICFWYWLITWYMGR